VKGIRPTPRTKINRVERIRPPVSEDVLLRQLGLREVKPGVPKATKKAKGRTYLTKQPTKVLYIEEGPNETFRVVIARATKGEMHGKVLAEVQIEKWKVLALSADFPA
jgi:hypothetical protein